MTWRNEYEKSVLLFTKHCIIDAKIAVGFDAEITAPENAKNTAFVIPGYRGIYQPAMTNSRYRRVMP